MVQGKSPSQSPLSHSPAPFLSEMGTKKLEAVLSDSMTKGEQTTEEVAAAMHVDFFRVSANSGAGIVSMFAHHAQTTFDNSSPESSSSFATSQATPSTTILVFLHSP